MTNGVVDPSAEPAVDPGSLAAEIRPLLAGAGAPPERAEPRGAAQVLAVPAARMRAGTVRDAGRVALRHLLDHVEPVLALLDHDEDLLVAVVETVSRGPVGDLRVDLEGADPGTATAAGRSLAEAMADGGTGPLAGVRVPSLLGPDPEETLRVLAGFLSGLGRLPDGFVLGGPAASVAEVEALALVCERLEAGLDGRLRLELEVGTPGTLVAPDGTLALARTVRAAGPRLATLALDPAAAASGPCGLADARALMRIAVAGTGVGLLDAPPPAAPGADDPPGAEHLCRVRGAAADGLPHGVERDPRLLPLRHAAALAAGTGD